MKWIRLMDRMPNIEIDGEKVLVYRIVNENQLGLAMSVIDTIMLKYSKEDETWWMSLPEPPNYNN